MVAVLPVFVLIPFLLFRYSRGHKKPDYQARWEESNLLEVLMWGVPAVLVAIMSVLLWNATYKLDPYRTAEHSKPTMNVQVVGLDWKWLFIYPDDGVASIGEFAIPVDTPVELTLTTDTVMQSFICPALAGQIYAMPGMTTKLNSTREFSC